MDKMEVQSGVIENHILYDIIKIMYNKNQWLNCLGEFCQIRSVSICKINQHSVIKINRITGDTHTVNLPLKSQTW